MKTVFRLTLLFFIIPFIGLNAQSLTDRELEKVSSGVMAGEIGCCLEYTRYAGIVIMEVATGKVVTNVSLYYHDGEFLKNPQGNTQCVPSGLGRSVLYLALMPETPPSMVQDVGDGLYVDSSGCVIEDYNHSHGGYGLIDLKSAYTHNSDVALLKTAEAIWGKDIERYREAINKAGIHMRGKVDFGFGAEWRSCDILGYTTYMSLLDQVCWINAVASKQSVTGGIDSLRSSMRACVTEGMGHKMNSEFVSVAAMTNRHVDAEGYKGHFAAAYFPYEKPEYTIGVYIWSKGNAHPSNVARSLIDWMACNRLSPHPSVSDGIKHGVGWIHPAAR